MHYWRGNQGPYDLAWTLPPTSRGKAAEHVFGATGSAGDGRNPPCHVVEKCLAHGEPRMLHLSHLLQDPPCGARIYVG